MRASVFVSTHAQGVSITGLHRRQSTEPSTTDLLATQNRDDVQDRSAWLDKRTGADEEAACASSSDWGVYKRKANFRDHLEYAQFPDCFYRVSGALQRF